MKKIITAAIILLINLCAFSQTDPVRTEQNHIFQYIDKTQIPSGYLNEYGPEVVDKKWLTGILSDSNFVYHIDVFNLLYNDIENSRLNSAVPAMLPLDSVFPYTDAARYDSVSNLAFISADYSILREDAIQQNLFTASNNQLFDVSGRTQSPYIFNHAFAAVPVMPRSPFFNEIRLGCQPLFYGNTGKTVAIVKVNFLDGAGDHIIYSNGTSIPFTKTYIDSSGNKRFHVKVQYSDNSIDECYTQQYVTVQNAGGQLRYDTLTPAQLRNPDYVIPPSAYLNVSPVLSPTQILLYPALVAKQHFNQNMKLYIRYSSTRNGTPLQGRIVKPFIIVEGYDITDAAPLIKEHNYNINTLLNEWDKINKAPTFVDFNKMLDENGGYDLIFIDYYTMRSITENADYLLQAIDWINSQKQNNAVGVREQNVIMGISMGGLVSRYALAKRTKQTGSNSTETRQLITMDSPHQGANVPLGMQHFLYDFGEVRIFALLKSRSEELRAFYYLNAQTATQQQLIWRVTDGNGNRVENTFLTPGGIYRTMVDYTAPYQFLAVSNGSQCAKPVLDPGALILQRSGNVATVSWLGGFLFKNKYRLAVQINALPTYGTQAQICSVVMERNIKLLQGLIGTGWTTTSNSAPRISPANTIPWDGVPGGTQEFAKNDLSQAGEWPNGKTFFGNILSTWGRNVLYIDYNITLPFSEKNFSFVPITSALDVADVTSSTFSQPFNYVVSGLNGSRANKFITQDFYDNFYNIEHTDFTPRNAKWIYNEMQNITQQVDDCDNYCDSQDPQIIGIDNTCISSSYSVSGLTPLASVTWSISNTNFATLSCTSCNTTTVNRVEDGTVILTATITSSCIGNITRTKTIIIGNGYADVTFYTGGVQAGLQVFSGSNYNNVCVSSANSIYVVPPAGSSVTWTRIAANPTNTSWNQSGNNLNFNLWAANQTAVFRLTLTGPCGTRITDYGFRAITCGGGGCESYSISPNPAKNQMNVIVTNVPPPCESVMKGGADSEVFITELKVYDQSGNLMSRKKYPKTKQAALNISSLRTGVYFVDIFDGKKYKRQQVIINK